MSRLWLAPVAEVEHGPGCFPDRPAGHAEAVHLEGDPARLFYPFQECRYIEIRFVSVHLVDVGVPGFLQLRGQVQRFGRHFLVPATTERLCLNSTLLRVNLLAGDRAEEVPVAVLELDQLHGAFRCWRNCGAIGLIWARDTCERPIRRSMSDSRCPSPRGHQFLAFRRCRAPCAAIHWRLRPGRRLRLKVSQPITFCWGSRASSSASNSASTHRSRPQLQSGWRTITQGLLIRLLVLRWKATRSLRLLDCTRSSR